MSPFCAIQNALPTRLTRSPYRTFEFACRGPGCDRVGPTGPEPSGRYRPHWMTAGFPRRVQAGGSNAPLTGPGTLSSAAARLSSIVAARSIPAPRGDRPPAPRYAPRRNHVSEQASNPRRLVPVRFDTAPDRLCECDLARFRAVAVWARTGTGATRGAARIAAGDLRKRLTADCDSRSAEGGRKSATAPLPVHYSIATPVLGPNAPLS